MAVNEIQGSSNLDPSKINEGSKLRPNKNAQGSEPGSSVQKGQDSVELSELARFTKLAQDIPTPNEGNIADIQKAIEDGKYNSTSVIDETATRIADQLL